ncbi:MAG: NAD(P)-dependent alcohol dehydrogenase [Chloroflexi bacterium]|nr:NAD(P)-dependent alcohol dehydrogenase [Chloroflexota bacterium]
MQAFIHTAYGAPADVLQLQEIAKPTPQDDEVLIKVQAVSLNASDTEFLTGSPIYARMAGIRKPSKTILGSDIAGRVEAVGSGVSQFQPGDAVLGDLLYSGGGFAAYVCAPATALVRKPDSLTFEQAAALPQAGVIAVQGVRDKRQVQPGDKVLINGAGGGAGTFAVQLAKLHGAEVTAVDSARKLDLLRSLGADHVIDYQQEDFARSGQRYDLILDLVARRSLFACRRVLAADGVYAMVGGTAVALLQAATLGPLIAARGDQKMGILAVRQNTADLNHVVELVEAGKLTPMIDQCYPLIEVPAALQYLHDGQALGKVVITVAADD